MEKQKWENLDCSSCQRRISEEKNTIIIKTEKQKETKEFDYILCEDCAKDVFRVIEGHKIPHAFDDALVGVIDGLVDAGADSADLAKNTRRFLRGIKYEAFNKIIKSARFNIKTIPYQPYWFDYIGSTKNGEI